MAAQFERRADVAQATYWAESARLQRARGVLHPRDAMQPLKPGTSRTLRKASAKGAAAHELVPVEPEPALPRRPQVSAEPMPEPLPLVEIEPPVQRRALLARSQLLTALLEWRFALAQADEAKKSVLAAGAQRDRTAARLRRAEVKLTESKASKRRMETRLAAASERVTDARERLTSQSQKLRTVSERARFEQGRELLWTCLKRLLVMASRSRAAMRVFTDHAQWIPTATDHLLRGVLPELPAHLVRGSAPSEYVQVQEQLVESWAGTVLKVKPPVWRGMHRLQVR